MHTNTIQTFTILNSHIDFRYIQIFEPESERRPAQMTYQLLSRNKSPETVIHLSNSYFYDKAQTWFD